MTADAGPLLDALERAQIRPCDTPPLAGEAHQLLQALRCGFALVGQMDLDIAQRLVASQIDAPPVGPDWTDYLQRLLTAVCELSVHDGLTGLWNRRYFDHRLQQELQRARREAQCCAVAMIDVDHFKKVNDRHGHAAGDHVLQTLASLMADQLRLSDEVTSRFGGEEFAVILPGTHPPGARLAMERLRQAVQDHDFCVAGRRIPVTISIGIAIYDPGWTDNDPTALLAGADAALYEAKREGRNRVRLQGQLGAQATTAVTREERDLLLPQRSGTPSKP